GVLAPRIADETAADSGQGAESFRLLVADREHEGFGGDRGSVGKADRPAFALARGADRGGVREFGAAAIDRYGEHLSEITREEAPLGETARGAALRLEPPREVTRLT